MPIPLSDRQSTAVASAAAALPAADRDGFYQAIAHQLTGREVGDGSVHRAVAAAFQAFFKPPETPHYPSRWQRDAPRFDRASKRAY
jgi:hypothetical protein